MTGNKNKFTQHCLTHSTGLRGLIIVILLLGIFFRLINLDKKVYWGDEVFTSLRLAGYTIQEFIPEVFDGQPKTIAELQQYQRPHPEKGLTPTIKALAIEDSQHPPLYYSIAWFWEQWFGSTIAIKRSLPALLSLLLFPCLYWLCLELFGIPLVAWVAVALIAISPFHVLYAQEAREYSLWTVTILLSSWALLRAIRMKTKLSWVIYAATLSLAFYTYLFSILIAIGHGIYVLLLERFRVNKTIKYYSLATLAALFTFTPWLFFVTTHLSTIQDTTNLLQQKVALSSLAQMWLLNLSRIFIDLDSQGRILEFGHPISEIIRQTLIGILIILVGYSLDFLGRHTPRRIWLFIFPLIGVTAINLILPDLIFGGIRSTATRYLIPCYLGIQLAVAYTLSSLIDYQKIPYFLAQNQRSINQKNSQNRYHHGEIMATNQSQDRGNKNIFSLFPSLTGIFSFRPIARIIILVIITAGILSCAISSQSETWWNKYGSYDNPPVARIVNQAQNPLLLSSGSLVRVISLSYLLKPKAQIQFIREDNIPQIPQNFSDIFFYRPPKQLKAPLEKQMNYQIETVYQSPPLYNYLEPIAKHSEIWLWKVRHPRYWG